MIRRALLAAAFAVATVSAWAEDWASQMFKVTEHDFGTIARSAKAEYAFAFTNPFVEEVHIAGARASCGCTSVRVENATVKTHESGAIIASINSGSFLGKKGATITVTIDRPYFAEVQLKVATFIRSDVMVDPGVVQFDSVDQGSAASRTVTVNYSGWPNWQVLGVRSANPALKPQVREIGRNGGQAWYELKVDIDPTAPAGYLKDHVVLQTNDQQNAEFPVAVEGRIVSSITISPASLFLGVVQPGQKITRQVVVQGKKPFKINSIQCADASFQFGKDDKEASVHLVPVTFVAPKNPGKHDQAIRIETDLGRPELSAHAVVVGNMTATSE